MSAATTRSHQRQLGAYYTPDLATYAMARWMLRADHERIVEPSFGDGAFLRSLSRVAIERAFNHVVVDAIDIDHETVAKTEFPNHCEVRAHRADFLEYSARNVHGVIGNPPFVRLRHLPKKQSAIALTSYEQATSRELDESSSTWLPFVAHAMRMLRQGGRMALVLPYEATYVRYGLDAWRHLGNSFGSLTVIRTFDRLFSDILQDVVVLYADHYGSNTKHVRYVASTTFDEFVKAKYLLDTQLNLADITSGKRVFKRALIGDAVTQLLDEWLPIKSDPIAKIADVRIGYVTGDKRFFHPDALTVKMNHLPSRSLREAVISSRKLSRAPLLTSALKDTDRAHLFFPNPSKLSAAELRYVEKGDELGVSKRYKCRIRDPWYVVPHVRVPDVLWGVFGSTPVMIENDAKLVASNSLLCGYLKGLAARAFVDSWYNVLTLLQAELQIHALGGGVLVLVPREVARIRLLRDVKLPQPIRKQVGALLKGGDQDEAYVIGSKHVLHEQYGMSSNEVARIVEATKRLNDWRER
jgi:adenine-specific DNA-methyltransferase